MVYPSRGCDNIAINWLLCICGRGDERYVAKAIKGAPWAFVPFLISMFLIVNCLDVIGVTKVIATLFASGNDIVTYGLSSFLFSNIINNIPMTTLFASILSNSTMTISSVYAVIIGSNLGALLSPVGALAGIMFLNILKEKEVDFKIKDFVKYGVIVSIGTMAVTLLILGIVL